MVYIEYIKSNYINNDKFIRANIYQIDNTIINS